MDPTIEALLALAVSDDRKWPIAAERPILDRLNTWVAFRESDRDTIKRVANWRDKRREYRVDPLPERIAEAWAHFLFGDDPTITPANETDAENLAAIIGDNELPSELERAAGLCVSEGEVWARAYVDPAVALSPLVDWLSRRVIFPLWGGPRLRAAAVVTELADPHGDKDTVYRAFECHAAGIVANVLFQGSREKLGDEVGLEQHPATALLLEEWQHNLPPAGAPDAVGLLIRVPNRLRSDRRVGVSDYHGILDTLLDLNEATVIGAHNARLTARKRAIVSTSAVQNASTRNDLELEPEEAGAASLITRRNTATFDSSEEVFVEDPLDAELGKAASSPFRVLEYAFDAAALIAWKRHLAEEALTRVGLTPQYVGTITDGSDGYAASGTALRIRLIATDKTGRGKARHWDDRVPKLLRVLALLDALSEANGGYGRQWADPGTPPVFERAAGLPEDELEEATRHQALVGAGIESPRAAIKDLHPDWDDDRVDEELDAIKASRPAASALGGMGLA
jgi:hypothetical protein